MIREERISVVMCTYNSAQYLQEQLESIASQTRPPYELVVCDDQSDDKTTEIVKAFAISVPFQLDLIINEKRLGSTKNFEKAIQLCGGDIIVLSDQDDVWHPQKLERMGKVFANTPSIGAVFTDAEMVDEYLRPLGYRLWQSAGFTKIEQRLFTRGRAVDVLLRHNVVTGATMGFRAKFKELVLPIPDIWVHDGWIALLIAATADLGMIDEPLVKYRQHSKQQIGAVMKGFSQRLAEAKQVDSNVYITGFKKYMVAQKRLLTSSNATYKERVMSQIEGKMHHMLARANMSKKTLWRLPSIFSELLALRYHRYSNGWESAAKDLFL